MYMVIRSSVQSNSVPTVVSFWESMRTVGIMENVIQAMFFDLKINTIKWFLDRKETLATISS